MSLQGGDELTPTREEFEALFVSDPNLETIRSHVGKFNALKTMGMHKQEIRHSFVLAWLLNPQETHGFRDQFLRSFLAVALLGAEDRKALPTALDVIDSDMMDAEIRREWRGIDLLVLSATNRWAFVIENKFLSKQHNEQLVRYLNIAKKQLQLQTANEIVSQHVIKVRGVFLTLQDEEPEEKSFVCIGYDDVSEIIERLVQSRAHPLADEVRVFITQYAAILKEETGVDDEQKAMVALAKRLYRDHRKALDFIVEHGQTTELAIAVESLFGQEVKRLDNIKINRLKYRYDRMDSQSVQFVPDSWFQALGETNNSWPGCEKFGLGLPVKMWVSLWRGGDGKAGDVKIFGEIGPLTNHEHRRALINHIKDEARNNQLRIGFGQGAVREGARYSRFFKHRPLAVNDVQDSEAIKLRMEEIIKGAEPEIDAVATALKNFVSSVYP